jgi:predicted membrane channel-forming protein YqfA (hemolysin III family)
VNRILKSVIFTMAAIYFLVDAIVMAVARPFANRITEHWIFEVFASGWFRCALIPPWRCLLCL